MTLERLSAALGGAIGASLRREDKRSRQTTRPPVPGTRTVSFLLAAPILDVIVWIGAAEFNALGGWHRLLSPSDLASSLVNNSFALWLLGMLVVLAFVLVIAQFALAQPEASATSG